jgi:hypothetical protein
MASSTLISAGAPRRGIAMPAAAMFVAAFAYAVLLQWHGDAYAAGWSADPDEAGHYVTGLMVRDYITSGFPEPPMAYAADYYEHYARVTLGHWPPVFYVVQAAWTLVFGVSTTSLLTLMAVLTAALTALTFWMIARVRPVWIASCCAMLLWASPLTVQLNRMLMSDQLVAIWVLCALLCYERYLDEPGWRAACAFGMLASAAIMTKGTGIVLAPVPLLAAILAQRVELLRRPDFWLPACLVVALCGPWYALAPGAMHERAFPQRSLSLYPDRVPGTYEHIADFFGMIVTTLVLMSFAVLFVRFRQNRMSNRAVAGIVFVVSVLFFRAAHVAWGFRHLLMLYPIVCYCAAVGAEWLHWRLLEGRRSGAVLLAGVLLATAAAASLRIPPKARTGIPEAAQQLLASGRVGANERILVVAHPHLEGIFVAAIAELDRRPGRYVARGWRQLTTPENLLSHNYHPKFSGPAELMAHFRWRGEFMLLAEHAAAPAPHAALVLQTIREYADEWEKMMDLHSGLPVGASPFAVYRLKTRTSE